MSGLVCLYCGTAKEGGTVLSLKDGQGFCPSCRCRQFVTPENYEKSWTEFDRRIGYCCTMKPDEEIPTVRLFKKG